MGGRGVGVSLACDCALRGVGGVEMGGLTRRLLCWESWRSIECLGRLVGESRRRVGRPCLGLPTGVRPVQQIEEV